MLAALYTQGWGVNDNQTFVSKIQNKYLNYNVLNFGQGGYGGVQSLILLKDEIKNLKNIKLVVYGFIEHHQYRNVARSSWLESYQDFQARVIIGNQKFLLLLWMSLGN